MMQLFIINTLNIYFFSLFDIQNIKKQNDRRNNYTHKIYLNQIFHSYFYRIKIKIQDYAQPNSKYFEL